MKPETEQLNGWKEIASHLERSVRCAQRWERNEKLPVRRHRHAGGASVYAFREELNAWWEAGQDRLRASAAEPRALSTRSRTKSESLVLLSEVRANNPNTSGPLEIEQMVQIAAVLFLQFLETLTVRDIPRRAVKSFRATRAGSNATSQIVSRNG